MASELQIRGRILRGEEEQATQLVQVLEALVAGPHPSPAAQLLLGLARLRAGKSAEALRRPAARAQRLARRGRCSAERSGGVQTSGPSMPPGSG